MERGRHDNGDYHFFRHHQALDRVSPERMPLKSPVSSSLSVCPSTPPLPPSCSPGGASVGVGALSYIEHRVSRMDTLAGVAIKYGVEEFGKSRQQSELLLSLVLILDDLRKRTNVTGRGEAALNPSGVEIRLRWRRKSRERRFRQNPWMAKYGRRFRGYRRRIRRMPYGGDTVTVGFREEMESHIDLIHGGLREITHLAYGRGGGIRRSDHSGGLGELNTNHGSCWRHDPFGLSAHLGPISRFRIFPHQLPPTRRVEVKHLVPRIRNHRLFVGRRTAVTTSALEASRYLGRLSEQISALDSSGSTSRPGQRRPCLGVPRNVKGWKKKFFFILGDEWEFSLRIFRDVGVPRVRGFGHPRRAPCAAPFEKARRDPCAFVRLAPFTTLPQVLESKSFRRCFKLDSKSMVPSDGDNGEDIPTGGAAPVARNEGESHHSRDEPRRGDHSQDGSVEYIGTIRKEMRKVFPHLPDLTFLRLLGEKSDHSSLVWNQVALALARRLVMLKKISRKKLAQMVEGSKGASSAVKSTPVAKWVVIGPRDEVPNISPSKKGKSASDAKKKCPISLPEEKKKGSSVKALAKAKLSSNKAASKAAVGEGTSANPGAVLGPKAFMLGNPTVAEKFLEGVIPPSNKEEVEKLDLDRAISRFFHGVGEGIEGRSDSTFLAQKRDGNAIPNRKSRAPKENGSLPEQIEHKSDTPKPNRTKSSLVSVKSRTNRSSGGLSKSGEVDLEVTGGRRCQTNDLGSDSKVTGGHDARGTPAKSNRTPAKSNSPKDEERDATMARLEMEMAELKKKAIAEFKASDEFQEAVEFIASRYFGEGFDSCKRQISRFHPDLNIQSMGIDTDLLEEEEEEEEEEDGEEGEKEEEQEKEGENGDTSPLSP
ncbi:peptidoglycan-binding LysM domain-containing protein [Actinidia rufa]|uniref:Peptidoglycan-binding LysM domain-containing protein n=1 Tax=Actinidia rufa TaxID=165716 RepID=A0A7J0GJD6_9ERIC|nr:peptidoglycan-binding LysM domain-containing protein [Actinidia rufa]